jgi:hypothetical protein
MRPGVRCLRRGAGAGRQYGISFVGFDKRLPLTDAPGVTGWERQDYVFVSLHRKEPVSDGFNHSALINAKLRKAWIHRTGGIAGVRSWYGPVDVEPGDVKQCETRPGPAARAASLVFAHGR